MLGLRIKLDKYPVKVLKCKTTDESTETKPRVDSGIVSKSSVKALLQTPAICDKVQHITKTGIVIKLFAIPDRAYCCRHFCWHSAFRRVLYRFM